MSQESKTAIVTGASRGIGAAIAKQLANDGFQVIVNYSSSESEAEKVVMDIQAIGGKAKTIKANVADSSEIKKLFEMTEVTFGYVDVLVNNAGVLSVSPLEDVADEEYEHQVSVNLKGTFNGMREGARRIRDGGRIINLSTSIIGNYIPNHGVYTATKAAVEALTHTLAKEMGARQITVNAVAPGPIETELLIKNQTPEFINFLIKNIPLGRLGHPEDIARVVSFLASPEGAWVNGQVIKVNGGRN